MECTNPHNNILPKIEIHSFWMLPEAVLSTNWPFTTETIFIRDAPMKLILIRSTPTRSINSRIINYHEINLSHNFNFHWFQRPFWWRCVRVCWKIKSCLQSSCVQSVHSFNCKLSLVIDIIYNHLCSYNIILLTALRVWHQWCSM